MSQPPNQPSKPLSLCLALWIEILLAVVLFVSVCDSGSQSAAQGSSLSYSEFLTKLDEVSDKSVEIRGPQIVGTLTNDQQFTTFAPEDPQLVERLQSKGVRFDAKPEEQSSILDRKSTRLNSSH